MRRQALLRVPLAIALLLLFAAPATGARASSRAPRASKRAAQASGRAPRAPSQGAQTARRGVSPTGILLGQDVVGARRDSLPSGRPEAFRFRAHASGFAGQVRLYIGRANTATTVIAGIYSNRPTRPGAPEELLGQGSISPPSDGAWNTLTLTPSNLVSGRIYWLAVLGEDGTLHFRARLRGRCHSSTNAGAGLTTLPASWSAHGVRVRTRCPISAYAIASAASLPNGTALPPSKTLPFSQSSPLAATLPSSTKEEPTEEKPKEESKEEPPPPPLAPVNKALPTINGSAIEGDTLTATEGAWENSPTGYKYQWQHCGESGSGCSDIAGASTNAHKLTASDVGYRIGVVVTATNEGGSKSATSAATAKIEKPKTEPPPPPAKPVSKTPPTIGGTTTEGDTLTATNGTWEHSPTAYEYQWQDCNSSGEACTEISNASSNTHKLAAGDVGHTLRVVVTAANEGGSTSATSTHTATVAAAPPPKPVSKTPPTISGTTTESDTLTATNGTWEHSPTAYEYQWQDCGESGSDCSNISGATGKTRILATSDVGYTIRVVVTAANSGGSTPATSPATATVAAAAAPPPPTNTALPTISGATTESQMLTATTGTWTGSPTSYAYQWEVCNSSGGECSAVAKATSSSYTLIAGDVGHTIRVTVTAANAGGKTPASSAATATITSPAKQPPPSPACTQTVSSTAGAASAVEAATTETAICLKAGAYGALDLSGAHEKNVTVEPEPGTSASVQGVNLAERASDITIHDFGITGGVSLAAGDSHITIDHNDIDGQGPGGIGEGVQTLSVNCSAPNAPIYSGCTSTAPDTYITINGNKIHGYGEGETEDAIHLNDWEHVTITANDIYDLEEHGNHTDAMQSVFGGHYMTFAYNYEHDNQSQGFFISDGDASEVSVTENLFLRNDNEPELYPGGEYNIQVFNTAGLSITNNTVWDGQDDIIRAEGAAEALTANVNHNVEQNFDVLDEGGPAYTLTEDYDIFKEEPFTFTMGSHSKVESSPDFVDPATEDYELASNPDGVGVDWQPSEYVYGPTGD